MSDAKARYGAADIRYVPAFDPHASPARLRLALALADTAWTPPDPERLTVLDIGCGRGLGVALLAAANPGWEAIGLDLQPAHVAEAREMAAEAGLANARFIEADLAELDAGASARLLPEVDIVVCHGVWTWVPDAVRAGIVALLRSRLRAGGLLLIGYNALPGFADCIGMQRLLHEAARATPGSEAEKGAAALALLEALRAAGAPYLPPAAMLDHVIAMARAAPAYMAHEWFTPFWRPVFHADLARDLAAARLDYGGTARPGASLPELNLRPAQREALAGLPAAMDGETLADAFLDRRFRTDIFVRGRRPGGRRTIGAMRFALAVHPDHAALQVETQSGVAALPQAAARAILGALAEAPRSAAELAALPDCAGLGPAEIALMLVESGSAHPLWRDPAADPALAARAARCNQAILRVLGPEALANRGPLGAVAPALGSAVAMGVPDLAVVAALQAGVPAEPEALAARIARRQDGPEAVATIREGVAAGLAMHLDAWRGLGVV